MAKAITLGPWGGAGGQKWSFEVPNNSLLKTVRVAHADIVDSITFVTEDDKGRLATSTRFGGQGGQVKEINLQDGEFLTSITGTVSWYANVQVIGTLYIHSNLFRYGPFGKFGGDLFDFPIEPTKIVGFHGRFGTFLDAIGIYVNP